MTNISIVCAPPHVEFNPGMHAVDLAGYFLFKEEFPKASVKLYTLHNPEPKLYALLQTQLPFRYHLLPENNKEFLESDLIIFWGDFLQNLPYHRGLSKRLIKYNRATSEQDAMLTIRRFFLLNGAPDKVLRKTIAFGINLFINNPDDWLIEPYCSDLHRFFSSIQCAYARDILSALNIGRIRNAYCKSFLGVDCALLLNNNDLIQNQFSNADLPKCGDCGIFLGRMPKDISVITNFLMTFKKLSGLSMEWIPWFWKTDEQISLISSVTTIDGSKEPTPLFDIYRHLSQYKLVITDTYHLCVNAWRLGIPAVCIGRGSDKKNNALSDKKKELFYEMYQAEDYYIFAELLKEPKMIRDMCHKVARLVKTHTTKNLVIDNIKAHTIFIRQRLISDAHKIINGT